MSTFTDKLLIEKPAEKSLGWHIAMYRNSNMMDAIHWQNMKQDFTIEGGELSGPSGLNINVAATSSFINGTYLYTAGSTLALTDDSVNFIYVSSAGVISKAAVMVTARYALLGIADCASGTITQYTDLRSVRQPLLNVQGTEPILGSIQGFLLESTGTNGLLQINPGSCLDSTGKVEITLSSAITKSVTNAWVEGSGNGGTTTTLGVGNTRAVYIIMKNNGAVDVMVTSPNADPATYLPAGYSWWRFVGICSGSVSANQNYGGIGMYRGLSFSKTFSAWSTWNQIDLTNIFPWKYVTFLSLQTPQLMGYSGAYFHAAADDMTGKVTSPPTAHLGDTQAVPFYSDPLDGYPPYRKGFNDVIQLHLHRNGVMWMATGESGPVPSLTFSSREMLYVR